MASALAEANIHAKQRLQQVIASAVAAVWSGLPHYNREQLDQFLTAILPLTAAANRQAVLLTDAFLARAVDRPPAGVNVAEILAGIRNGTTPADVYSRPFITVWTALSDGKPWDEAVKLGLARATSAAATDVQLSFTHTLRAIGRGDDRIHAYRRVPDATACQFCRTAGGQLYYHADLMPLHPGCGCGVEPVGGDNGEQLAPARFDGPDGLTVAVRDHGELGPVLTNAADHFTGPAGIPH